jgi:hypothetical protein
MVVFEKLSTFSGDHANSLSAALRVASLLAAAWATSE